MTLPQEHLAVSVSEREAEHPQLTEQPPGELICPAVEIFDGAAVRRKLDHEITPAMDWAELRAIAIEVLHSAFTQGKETIAAEFAERPRAARETTRSYSWLTDCLIRQTFDLVVTHAQPQSPDADLALIAVGGYGRGEMAPCSDVDLLFLTNGPRSPWAEGIIEATLYILWDLHLKVGHASRTMEECLALAQSDFTIRTALLEHRPIAGAADLAEVLDCLLWEEVFEDSARDFIEAKLAERELRHEKQGGQRYMVEPNVKEGKGGLRDLQSLFWIGKYLHRVTAISELVALNVFISDEFSLFERAENFLWAVRCHLHLITKRPNDQLTFDLQVQVAERMGYTDKGGRRAVEHFMQDYFRHATAVGDLTRIFLTKLEASHAKNAPLLDRLFSRKPRTKAGYKVVHGRLDIVDAHRFLADKLNLLRLFEEGLRTGMLIHPDAMRLATANLHLIDDDMRENKEAQRIFMDLLLKHGNPERALRRMNELGVLSAFIPEFEPIVAMMQFNMYHSYTVDEHIIQCIRHLAMIERGELSEELPVASSILGAGVNRKVLYAALLLHDIGKGRTEDHSVLGAQIARKVAPRLGLGKQDSETVEWLVRYHLLMSDMAQKRDISDPRTVRDFAKAVQTVKRLDLLTVLTVCDIRGVGPTTWNNWKATLLRNLYGQTRRALETGLEDLNREQRGADAKRALRDALSDWDAKAIKQETARHYAPYWQGLPVSAHVVFARLLADIEAEMLRIDLHPDEDRDATRACFALTDHPGIFSRLAGALALVGANIVDARTYTSRDGYATAAFWIQDADGHPYESERLPHLREIIKQTFRGEVVPTEAIKSKDKIKKRERAFRVPTSITFDNEGSEIYTIIEVDTRDRPGLLFDLTRTLANANVYIASAVIATYGEQVVDTFYVKDMFGLKLYTEGKRDALEKKLREAITTGVERATA